MLKNPVEEENDRRKEVVSLVDELTELVKY